MWVKKQQLELDMEEQTGSELGKNTTKLYMSPCLFNLYARVHHVKCQAGWITSWNQDFQEKYQQPHMCRWYHSNGGKGRGTREPLDEDERGE